MNTPYRLRIAPSPTGYPHIGTIYQALFNYAYAKKHNGKFIVRIEDTDRTRFVEEAADVIFSSLDWFGLIEDESPRKGGPYAPYTQSERLPLYHKYVQELLDKDKAYYAYYPKKDAGVKKEYSSATQVPTARTLSGSPDKPRSVSEMIERGDWIVRMRVPEDAPLTFHDEIRGDITFEPNQITHQVLLKSDGYPTYHLAVVVDDHVMGITHVVRAEEWISSTPKHVLLYRYFGWEIPAFYHTPDLRNPDKSKLSKRHGHTNVQWYQEAGYLPEAVLNFLALQGWSHPEGKEIFSLEEFIRVFELHDVKAVGPIFDMRKLDWMNGEYIRSLSPGDLRKKLYAFDAQAVSAFTPEVLTKLVILSQSRMVTLKDFATLTGHMRESFSPQVYGEYSEIARALYEMFKDISSWKAEHILYSIKNILLMHKVKMSVLYTIFTDQPRGLPLPELLELIGKERTLHRLAAYV